MSDSTAENRTAKMSSDELTGRLTHPGYPRSNRYDARWIIENQMGPHPLWLLEWLAPALRLEELRPGARVLDLGCGRALTSVFLAKEYDVQVVAADLWIKPDDNAVRITEAGVADRVLPMHAEAHDLPFAEGTFDAIVSVDAYHYFGSDALYLPSLARLLKPGGRIGVVVPALREEPAGTEPPEHLKPFWEPDFWSFHSADWWRRTWERSAAVAVEAADWLADGWRDWLLWSEVCAEESPSEFMAGMARESVELVRTDRGRALGFIRVVGRRTPDLAGNGDTAASWPRRLSSPAPRGFHPHMCTYNGFANIAYARICAEMRYEERPGELCSPGLSSSSLSPR